MKSLVDNYLIILNEFEIGYPVKEESVGGLWELVQLIECIKYADYTPAEYNKMIFQKIN